MKIGYCKLGRSIHFNKDKFGMAGDPEAPQLLERLAQRNPEVEWVLIGKNDGHTDYLPANVSNPPKELGLAGQPYRDARSPDRVPEGATFHPNKGNRNRGQVHKESGWYIDPVAKERDDKLAAIIGDLDGMVIHLGQHGTSHFEIPQSKYTWQQFDDDFDVHSTTPQMWARNYGAYLIEGMNAMGDRTDGAAPVVWLCADPRNYHKARDFKWPTGTDQILAQYAFSKDQRHERFRDPRRPEELGFGGVRTDREGELWVARHQYLYGGLELMILPDDWEEWGEADFHDRKPAGIATTSYAVAAHETDRRSWIVNKFLLAAFPEAEVFGKWDAKSLEDVPPGTVEMNNPKAFPSLLNSWRVTMCLPVSAGVTSNAIYWTAAKPYQCMAANVAAFMVGKLDGQGWILPTTIERPGAHRVSDGLYSVRDDWTDEELHLARILRVTSFEEFNTKAKWLSSDQGAWEWVTEAQNLLLQKRWDEHLVESLTEEMLGLWIDP